MKGILLWLVIGCGMAWATTPVPEQEGNRGEVVAEEDEKDAEVGAGEETRWKEIPEAQAKLYFEKKPDGFLIDPQRLLSPVVRRNRAAFLEYHAGDSSIDLHVYLIEGDQGIPEVARCEEVMGRFFAGDKPSAVVWYAMGAPERSVLYLSPRLREDVPEAENKRALASSVMQAVEKSDPAGQLEAFLVQMSIRLYWMEKLIGKEGAAEQAAEVAVVVPPAKEEKAEVGLVEKLQPLLVVAREWAMEVGVVLGVCILLVVAMVWSRLRARHILPDFSIEPRLGGEHGAGVGAVISFASASVPPASQREKLG